jgi:hypothetical protein
MHKVYRFIDLVFRLTKCEMKCISDVMRMKFIVFYRFHVKTSRQKVNAFITTSNTVTLKELIT